MGVLQKTIYSVPALRELLEAANRRYLEFLSAMEDPRAGRNKLDKLSQSVEQQGRRYSGFNLFNPNNENLLCSICARRVQHQWTAEQNAPPLPV